MVKKKTLAVETLFTKDVHPFESVKWTKRDVVIKGPDGSTKFEMKDVEAPEFWSDRAVTIVAEKYFRVIHGKKETSVQSMIYRVAGTIATAAHDTGLMTVADSRTFALELMHMLVYQMFSFNSPVWFNVGITEKPQASACFIQSVKDDMESITALAQKEVRLFKGGSGTGTNLSPLRSSYEKLAGGGYASGPVSFMKMFDAGAGVTKSGGTTRRAAKMVIMNVDHPDILEQRDGSQGFITCKQHAEQVAHDLFSTGKYTAEFNVPGNVYDLVGFQNANNSVRVSDAFMEAVKDKQSWPLKAVTTGETVKAHSATLIWDKIAEAAWACGDPGLQFDDLINAWHTVPNSGRINSSNPCAEFVFLDNTSCNLGSLNLMKFLRADNSFDVEGFQQAVRIAITAMETLVSISGYPSPEIAENSRKFRPLGLGYANLGAALMAQGLAYDSDAGRDWAASVTALMTGTGYQQSAALAQVLGAFEGYSPNQASMRRVIMQHANAATFGAMETEASPDKDGDPVWEAASAAWSDVAARTEPLDSAGFRNAQISVLAPTGTISFAMDCDTSGIEPALGLVVFKKLVGGGVLKLPNQLVGRALESLGYSRGADASPGPTIKEILDHVTETGDVVGAPLLKPEHLPVFATAIGKNAISPMGHIKMMAAVQPLISGAISKTVNMANDCTVDDVKNVYQAAYDMGLKAIAIYRDGCKLSQPASAKVDPKSLLIKTEVIEKIMADAVLKPRAEQARHHVAEAVDEESLRTRAEDLTPEALEINAAFADGKAAGYTAALKHPPTLWGERKKLPNERQSITKKFKVGSQEGYLHIGLYENGKPAELFIDVAKAGSALAGFADWAATMFSVALQHGAPLEDLVEKMRDMKFEPSGFTGEKDFKIATSIPDYVGKFFEHRFLNGKHPEDAVETPLEEKTHEAVKTGFSGPPCGKCSNLTTRAGSCWVCASCGTTTGCG